MEEMNNTSNYQDQLPPDRKGFAITSLVLGIVSILSFCVWFFSIPCAILAVIFGALSLKSSLRGLAIAGLVTGIVGFSVCVILYIIIIAGGFEGYRSYKYNF